MDYDTYSANDAIGRIYLDLCPLVQAASRLETVASVVDSRGDAEGGKASREMLTESDRDAHNPCAAHMSGWLPILDTMHGNNTNL